jgi:glycosyltransferase involved in cell wall biosynthesis
MELKNKGITAFLPVYNEEKRIDYTLQSLVWCDEVIVLDKQSTDNTVKIAEKYPNVRILTQENTLAYTASEHVIFLNACTTKWCMVITASDIIHPDLALRIKTLTDDETFDYDAIRMPFRCYVLGVYEKYSPWYSEFSNRVVRTKNVTIDETGVHLAFQTNVKTVYEIEVKSHDEAYYHLTHESADSMIERHRRYWNGEATSSEPLSDSLRLVIIKSIKFLFTRRTFFKGKSAIALAFAYLSYIMMTYVYKWDHEYSRANETYDRIRKNIMDKWKEGAENLPKGGL